MNQTNQHWLKYKYNNLYNLCEDEANQSALIKIVTKQR